MSRVMRVEQQWTLEEGAITILSRPRVESEAVTDLDDVQRMLLLLAPTGSSWERLIAIGRRRLPAGTAHQRFWGFVDMVLTPRDMQSALGTQLYGTKAKGLRHLPAAERVATGNYCLDSQGGHGHLRWNLDHLQDLALAAQLSPPLDADYLVTIANPDPAAWGLSVAPDLQSELFDDLELHVPLPTPFPPALQRRFGKQRYAALDSAEWLDHPGAELVFVQA